MAGCSEITLNLDWSKIPVERIRRNMTSMTSTLSGDFGKYANLYKSLGADPEEQAKLFDNWYVLENQHLWHPGKLGDYDPEGYLETLAKTIAKPLKPAIRFYWLKAGQELGAHVDFATKACINFVYQSRFASIVVDDVPYPYGKFLLDNTKMHGVPACDMDRFIVSFAFGQSYEDVRRRCGVLKESN